MAVQTQLSTWINTDTAPTVRTNANAIVSTVNNLLLALRTTIQAGETLTIYTFEALIKPAHYTVQGHVVVQGHLRVA